MDLNYLIHQPLTGSLKKRSLKFPQLCTRDSLECPSHTPVHLVNPTGHSAQTSTPHLIFVKTMAQLFNTDQTTANGISYVFLSVKGIKMVLLQGVVHGPGPLCFTTHSKEKSEGKVLFLKGQDLEVAPITSVHISWARV